MAKTDDTAPVPGTEDSTEPSADGGGMSKRTSIPVAPADKDQPVTYEDVPQEDTGPQVRYTGPATKRILGPDDWETVGVDDTDHKTYVWDLSNAKQIAKSEFSPKQLAYLKRDNRFVVEGD